MFDWFAKIIKYEINVSTSIGFDNSLGKSDLSGYRKEKDSACLNPTMITKEQVEHVAKLARLHLSEEETELYAQQLSKILDYIDQLNEVNTEGVEPMTQPIPTVNVMRGDVSKKQFERDEMLKNAPHEEYGFFRVPKIGE